MRIALPTEQQIADLHEHLLAKNGGLPGSRVGASASAVLGRIQAYLAYGFDEPTIPQAAALAVYAFVVGHPFNDANRRTALAVGDLVLLMNGERVILQVRQIELADWIIDLAAGKADQDAFMAGYVEMHGRAASRT
ncbi:MAG: type II toxin-antitoxin system death-on-curing family toxin [Gammaproteobacteria bacterium]|nr:type II toxin-antitoxin system death-on-curing family toxin [Gammaproteobacteria bacterium]